MRLFKNVNIDFMGKRMLWYSISIATLVIALGGLFFKGLTLGIDFLGGTELLVRFQNPVEINSVRAAMDKSGFAGCEIKYLGDVRDVLVRTPKQEEGAKVATEIQTGIKNHVTDNPFEILREDKIGPKIGAELRRNAVYAVFATLAVMLLYIGMRFKFVYGLAGVIALFHDTLVTLGFVVFFDGLSTHLNLELSLNLMAAFLTLIGFSMNDTVIVFDRIRENIKIHKSESLFAIINKSINETLSRTIITSGTVIMVLLVLIIFGGEVNRGFAFTFLIGTITGTYSSIYVASAIVLDYTQYKAKKAKKV